MEHLVAVSDSAPSLDVAVAVGIIAGATLASIVGSLLYFWDWSK